MISKIKRHDVLLLREAGHTQEETAQITGVSVRSVRNIEKDVKMKEKSGIPETSSIPDTPGRRTPGRPPKVEAFRNWALETLKGEPDLQTLELLRRAKNIGYGGRKSAFFAMVKSIRPKDTAPLVRFDGFAGEFSQHDFGTVDIKFVDGRTKRYKFFASRLKYSRYSLVSLVDNERTETLIRTLLHHFETWGGMPLLAVFDRPTTVALEWKKDGTITKFNPAFATAALEVGFGVEVCFPYSPNEKGSVENLVGWVKGSFFKQRRFLNEDDLSVQLEHSGESGDRMGLNPGIHS